MNRSCFPNILLLAVAALLAACEPMAMPLATPQVVVITAVPSNTPLPTVTPTLTPTSTFTPTPANTPTPTTMPCMSQGGRVEEFNDNFSPVANENLRYRVYVPPCYLESQKRFPVVYLLHGSSFRETQWENIGVVQALEQQIRLETLGPMILVMPYFGNIGNLNQFPPDDSYETVILDELVPTIDRDFCTIRNRDHRALGGISRGGFWAMSIGFRHPDVFGSLGGHSAALDVTSAPPANNPLDLARNAATLDDVPVRIYMDNGADDYVYLELQTFSSRLTARQIPHAYSIYPTGGHNEDYWSSHVGEYLEFYGAEWATDINALPSCAEPSP
ncbi:MAG: alpha/beta hydrolase-fold protein [Chloroflexota bacterium]